MRPIIVTRVCSEHWATADADFIRKQKMAGDGSRLLFFAYGKCDEI